YRGTADVWAIRLGAVSTTTDGVAVPRAFLTSRHDERGAVFSPNSRFVAYMSDESGSSEIYVVPYPGPGAPTKVSRGGGVLPHWSPDGRELFYMNDDQMMVADVETSDAFSTQPPRSLFPFPQVTIRGFPYSVAEDGSRFLMLKRTVAGGEQPTELNIVVNW